MASAPNSVEVIAGRIMRRNIERALAFACLAFGSLLILYDGIFASSPFYGLIAMAVDQHLFGLALFALGLVRVVVLIVNGFWPVGPQVRLALSNATLLCAWVPFTLSFWSFALNVILREGPGGISPGVILAPIVAWAEAMCALALRAWIEAVGAKLWGST